jgi:C-terminal processing protease CtpA/Prc
MSRRAYRPRSRSVRFTRKRALCALLVACVTFGTMSPLRAAPSADERLLSLAQLWGDIRYFDPWLAYRNVDWDAAALAAIPEVANASSNEAFASAVQHMLAVLRDPFTGLAPSPASPRPNAGNGLSVTIQDDRTAVLSIAPEKVAGADDPQFEAAAAKLAPMLNAHPNVVIDLRPAAQESAEQSSAVDSLLTTSPVATTLIHGDLRLPTQRTRYYTGLRNQFLPPDAEPFYTGGFMVDDAAFVHGKAATPHKIAFVVNANAVVPDLAVALVSEGQAVVFSDGPAPALLGGSVAALPVGDHLTAQFRTSEYAELASAQAYAQPLPAKDNPVKAAAVWLENHAPQASQFDPAPPAKLVNDTIDRRAYFPDEPHRVLAVFKIYSIIRYFFPYRDLMHEDWDALTLGAIADVRAAHDERTYFQTIRRYYAHIHDGHGFVGGAPLGELFGGWVPWTSRYLHGQVVVTALIDPLICREAGVRIGDVVTAVDGIPIQRAMAARRPFVNGSTPQSVNFNLVATGGSSVFSGPRNTAITVTLRHPRARSSYTARLTRATGFLRHPRSGPIVRILPGNVGYVDLDRLEGSSVDAAFAAIKATRAVIFDDRGYPLGTAWQIAPRLSRRTNFKAALFDELIVSNPQVESDEGGLPALSFQSSYQMLGAGTGAKYLKPVIVLVDERTLSQAEHTALFFEAAAHATFVGTPTAGANGDVTMFGIPGGITLAFSGLGVRHADGAQLQRVGIIPQVRVEPSAADIAAGRDVVLEAGVQQALRRSGASETQRTEALQRLRRLDAAEFAQQVATTARVAAEEADELARTGQSLPGASNTGVLAPAAGSPFKLSSTDPTGNYKVTSASTDAAPYHGKGVHVFGLLDPQASLAAFFVRVDVPGSTSRLDMMINRIPNAAKGPQPFSIVLPVPENASRIYYGLWVDGAGSISASHVQIEIVPKETPSTEGCAMSC